MKGRSPFLCRGDLDGFFGLFIDNLVQLLLIVALCSGLCGMQGDESRFISAHILPGAAVSILIGNLFYAWQARRIARREGRDDVTALPYGINTPSLLVYVFFVMAPAYRDSGSAEFAWRMGLFACVGSGVIEFFGSFVAERIRKHTPRAALLSTLAGIAIGFISMTFALHIWQRPLVSMLPLAIILMNYFARVRFPLGLPGGLVAIIAGTCLAWVLPESWSGQAMSAEAARSEWAARQTYLPLWAGGEILEVFKLPMQQWLGYVSVIVPMGLFNIIGSLQNIESAEAGGDSFETHTSLATNGLGTIAAALCGSCFPTTIYIGHPGWKAMGARTGYSTLNGVVITALCLSGTLLFINSIIPIEAGIAIVLWIGIIITAQSFQATPTEHAPAVAVGLFPAIAAWGSVVVAGAFTMAQMVPVTLEGGATGPLAPIGPGQTMQDVLTLDHPLAGKDAMVNGFYLHGMHIMERGYIFTCMILSAIAAFLIDRKFKAAAAWALVATGLTASGLMHSYQIVGNDIHFLFVLADPLENAYVYRGYEIAVGYLFCAAAFYGGAQLSRKGTTEAVV